MASDGGDHRMFAMRADDGRRIGSQRGDADDGFCGGKADAARGREADTQACKTAGSCGRSDAA